MSTGTPSQTFCKFSAKPTGKMLLPVFNGEHFVLNCAARLKKAGKIPGALLPSSKPSETSLSRTAHERV